MWCTLVSPHSTPAAASWAWRGGRREGGRAGARLLSKRAAWRVTSHHRVHLDPWWGAALALASCTEPQGLQHKRPYCSIAPETPTPAAPLQRYTSA